MNNNNSLVYDYFIKDHLGNTRMTLTEDQETQIYLATMESEHQVFEDNLFLNVSGTRETNQTANFTVDATISANEVARLNGSDVNRRIGPAKLLAVSPGDQINMEAWAYHTGGYSNAGDIGQSNLVTALATAFGGSASAAIGTESRSIYELFNTNAALAFVGSEGNSAQPKAYLNYLLFDQDFNYVDGGFAQTSNTANIHQQLTLSKSIVEGGYIYIYLSNESQTDFDVYFDDLRVTHTKGAILQEDHYYPFGLSINALSSSAPLSKPNRFKYNGKEFQSDFNLGWYDYGARMYDPTISRWNKPDNHADNYFNYSPYNYVLNNPMNIIDPDGNDIYVLAWFSQDGETGHAGIAIDNYKTVEKRDENGDLVYDDEGNVVTEQVKDGTVTYYDLWPYNPVSQYTQLQDDVEPDYTNGRVMSLDDLINTDPTNSRNGNVGAEGRKADGIVQIETSFEADEAAKFHADWEVGIGRDYNACTNNCSTFTQRIMSAAIGQTVDASQIVRPSGVISAVYDDASAVAPNNLYNKALKIKGAKIIRGPNGIHAKPYLECFAQQ